MLGAQFGFGYKVKNEAPRRGVVTQYTLKASIGTARGRAAKRAPADQGSELPYVVNMLTTKQALTGTTFSKNNNEVFLFFSKMRC